jgi:hypothetical protein
MRGLIDFEYKKYLLLAYLKEARKSFENLELYPFLKDLIFHYRNLIAVKENKALLRESFPQEISLEEFQKLELSYREIVEDDAIMAELESIIEFSIPKVQGSIREGTLLYDYVESQCEISPVGVTPLYAKEGYLFITQPPEKETTIYKYQMSIFEDSQEDLRGLHTHFLNTVSRSPSNSYENIKLGLVKQFRELPNPATYLIVAKRYFPFTSTLMPVVKRIFIKHLSKAA